MAKPNLLLISATELESGTIQSELGDGKTTQHVGKTVIVGDLCGWRCTLIHTGIGAVNAAHALTCQLERQNAGSGPPIWDRRGVCADGHTDSIRRARNRGGLRRLSVW